MTSSITGNVVNHMQTDDYWKHGRLVVHTVGGQAGLMRLDMDLKGLMTREEVDDHVKLIIPGETSPLPAIDVVGEEGRFIVSFFSSDIANAGHLPAEAVVSWDAPLGREMRPVEIVSATSVAMTDGESAVSVPGGTPGVTYPRDVGIAVLVGIFAVLICVVAILTFG